MAVTVALYEYHEDMNDEVLSSMGVKGGVLSKLTTDIDSETERELLNSTDEYAIGSSAYDFPRRIMDEMQGLTEVDEIFITTMEAIADELADEDEGRYDAEETLSWVRNREGEQIFVQAL